MQTTLYNTHDAAELLAASHAPGAHVALIHAHREPDGYEVIGKTAFMVDGLVVSADLRHGPGDSMAFRVGTTGVVAGQRDDMGNEIERRAEVSRGTAAAMLHQLVDALRDGQRENP